MQNRDFVLPVERADEEAFSLDRSVQAHYDRCHESQARLERFSGEHEGVSGDDIAEEIGYGYGV